VGAAPAACLADRLKSKLDASAISRASAVSSEKSLREARQNDPFGTPGEPIRSLRQGAACKS
jgi:hypothetical protein